MTVKSFKDLFVWQKSFNLTQEVYKLCAELPEAEKFGLAVQLRRSSVSIVSNIAEGYERNNRGEYLHFLGIARASSAELEAQLLLVETLYGLDIADSSALLTEVQKMLYVISNRLIPHP